MAPSLPVHLEVEHRHTARWQRVVQPSRGTQSERARLGHDSVGICEGVGSVGDGCAEEREGSCLARYGEVECERGCEGGGSSVGHLVCVQT